MRVSLVFLLVFGLAGTIPVNGGPVRQSRALHDDLTDFLALIPRDKVGQIFNEYLTHDKEVQFVIKYIQSGEFKELVKAVENIPDVINFYNYLQESGLDIYYAVNKLHEIIGLPPLVPSRRSSLQITGGVVGLIADIKAVLPLEDIKALYHKKLETSVEFKKLVERLQSPKFQAVVDTLIANKEFQAIVQQAKKFGVDVKAVSNLLATIFGLEFPEHRLIRSTRALHDDLENFLALVPKEKVLEIFYEYVITDKEVQAALDYVMSDEFVELFQTVENMEYVQSLIKYLAESGLDVYRILNWLHDFLGLEPVVPRTVSGRITGGVAGLIADIKATLPVEEIKALYHEKLESSDDFKKLIERLQADEFQVVIDAVFANEEFQEMLKRVKALGVDVGAILDVLNTMLGLEFPERRIARALHDDLEDFFSLVPRDKVAQIFNEYLAHDKEVQFVVKYIQSSEFRELVKVIENIPDVIHFYNYLQESGLDVYNAANKLHELIGLPPLFPPRRSSIKITGGVAGLIADIKAILPFEDIKALYHEKLETSVEFKKLVERLKSPKFQAVIDTLLANEEFQMIIQQAKEFGVDVKVISSLLSTIFGLEFPDHSLIRTTRALHDDFEDFLALIPQAKVREIIFEYLQNDKEVQYVVEYVQSDEFKVLVQTVENIPDVLNFYNYLQESGLDIYAVVNKLHAAIGLPPLVPKRSLVRITGGVAGLIADIKATLPLQEIKDLYHKKLETSVEFKKLVERLQSPKFQAVIDTLLANKEFQAIVQQGKEFGIDVKAVADLFSTVFGIEWSHTYSKRHSRTIYVDFADFEALVPREQVRKIVQEYLLYDEEFNAILLYVRTKEFSEVIKTINSIEDVLVLYQYLDESGLDVYTVVNKLHVSIGLPPVNPKRSGVKITGGLRGLVADIKAVLPLDKFAALYEEKMQSDPVFQVFIARLHLQICKDKFQVVFDNEDFRVATKKLQDGGIDVEFFFSKIKFHLGIDKPTSLITRNLQKDFDDFLLLLPFKEITKISLDYLFNDPEVQQAAEYVKSQELRDLVVKLQNDPEVYTFLKYFEDSGANIIDLVNLLNDLLGLPPYPQPFYAFDASRADGGVHAMLVDIRTILPHDQIKALYETKLQTSDDFRYFIERLKDPELQALVDKMTVNKNMLDLGYQAQQYGIIIEHIVQFLGDLFGLQFPDPPWFPPAPRAANDLATGLRDFVDLLPVEEMAGVVANYLVNDKEIQGVIVYVRSESFKNLIKALNEIPEYHQILEELNAAGLDVYQWITIIHDLINWDGFHTEVFHSRGPIDKPGLTGLIKSIKALLPHSEIKVLYHEKLENSEAFRKLVAIISSDKFQTITNTLFANKDFQEVLHEAQAHGVNLQIISDFFFNIFGITTPPGVINFY